MILAAFLIQKRDSRGRYCLLGQGHGPLKELLEVFRVERSDLEQYTLCGPQADIGAGDSFFIAYKSDPSVGHFVTSYPIS